MLLLRLPSTRSTGLSEPAPAPSLRVYVDFTHAWTGSLQSQGVNATNVRGVLPYLVPCVEHVGTDESSDEREERQAGQ